eukprot:475630_1
MQSSLLVSVCTIFIAIAISPRNHIGCYSGESCNLSSEHSTFTPHDVLYCTSSVKSCTIYCVSPNSCESLTIYSAAQSTNVICNSTRACYNTTIRIGDTSVYPIPFTSKEFTNSHPTTSVHCASRASCCRLNLYFVGSGSDQSRCNLFCGDMFNNECLEATLHCNGADRQYCQCHGNACESQQIAQYFDDHTTGTEHSTPSFEKSSFRNLLVALFVVIVFLVCVLLVCYWKFEIIYDYIERKRQARSKRTSIPYRMNPHEEMGVYRPCSMNPHEAMNVYRPCSMNPHEDSQDTEHSATQPHEARHSSHNTSTDTEHPMTQHHEEMTTCGTTTDIAYTLPHLPEEELESKHDTNAGSEHSAVHEDKIDNEETLIEKRKHKIQKILEKQEEKRLEINRRMQEQHDKIHCLPLRQFSAAQLGLKIQAWMYNDINYRENLRKTMEILANHGISGERIISSGIKNVQKVVESEFALFMTVETSNILVQKLSKELAECNQSIYARTFAEIGWLLHSAPLDQLLGYIESEGISGKQVISRYETGDEWIKQNTGWNANDIYHINSILFRHHTLSKDEIETRLSGLKEKIKYHTTFQSIQSQLLRFDLEEIDLRIRHGLNINEFSDSVSNMIDDLVTRNRRKKRNSEHYNIGFDDEDIIKTIYDMIADVFVASSNSNLSELHSDRHLVRTPTTRPRRLTTLYTAGERFRIDLNARAQRDWICYNCGNENFNQCINGKMSIRCDQCRLCGIKERESITMTLMNKDTFVMVREVKKPDIKRKRKITNAINIKIDNDHKHGSTVFTVQELIQHVLGLDEERFDLSCLSRTDNEPCPSIMRLVKDMLVYKQWLDVLSDQNERDLWLSDTVQADVLQFVDNEMFKKIFMDCAQNLKPFNGNPKAMKALEGVISDVMDIDTFWKTERREFAKRVTEYTNNVVKKGPAVKLFNPVKKKLKSIAHQEQFGVYLSSLDITQIDKDYDHIWRIHINQGNRVTIQNVFRFFALTLHFCDGHNEHVNCRSAKRTQKRINALEVHHSSDRIDEEKEQLLELEELKKDVWGLDQYYLQSELDKMHTFLVHTDWEEYINANKPKHTRHKSVKSVSNRSDVSHRSVRTQRSHKFITVASDKTKYGFGIEYSYIHLKGMFECLRDELMQNKLIHVTTSQYQNLLIKAIKKHRIILENDEHNLICKYFKFEYNIIRNQPIGIRHFLAVIMYTDLSKFCTAFRATYRKIENEGMKEMTKRHTQLYWYSRFLFESVEFFGQEMDKTMRVYHGLSKAMKFERFTTYFNQPISSTLSFVAAKLFARGSGVILKLRRGVLPTSVTPKYLSVSWLSGYPEEDEKLFYGTSAFFEICDIIETNNNKHHAKELKILNKFEKIINGYITWDESWADKRDNPEQVQKQMVDDLVGLIKFEVMEDQTGNSEISKYGRSLFKYLCDNQSREWICIKNFKSLPSELKDALFIDITRTDPLSPRNNYSRKGSHTKTFSFIPILRLFGYLRQIVLNDLNIIELMEETHEYIAAVKEFEHQDKLGNYLQKIEFRSTQQFDGKQNVTLRNLAKESLDNWNIQYELRLGSMHCLVFSKDKHPRNH